MMNLTLQRTCRSRLFRAALIVLLVVSLLARAPVVSAQTPPTLRWTGGGMDTDWSTANNWVVLGSTTHRAPQDGDALLFDAMYTANGIILTNNLNGLDLAGIVFNANNLSITGSSFSTPIINIVSINHTITINTPLTVPADCEVTVASSGSLNLNGALSGAGGVVKKGPGTIVLSSTNSLSGTVEIQEGTVRVSSQSALPGGPIVVDAAGILEIDLASFNLANPLTLAGKLLLQQAGTFSGPLSVVGNQAVIDARAGSQTYILSGAISGADSASVLTLSGASTGIRFQITGNQANTFTGTIKLTGVQLDLNKPAGVTAVSGLLSIENYEQAQADWKAVSAAKNGQFASSAWVQFGPYTSLAFNGTSQTLRGFSSGLSPCKIHLGDNPDAQVTVQTQQTGNTSYCEIIGKGSILVTGNGLQDFSAPDGATWRWTGGNLVVRSGGSYLSRFKMTGLYRVEAGGYGGLDSGSEVGPVEVSGSRYFSVFASGLLNKAGGLNISVPGSLLLVRIEPSLGPALTVDGPVTLGGASLLATSLDPTNLPAGQPQVAIQITPSGPAVGTFAGLPEGAQTDLSEYAKSKKYPIRISYVGGTGNDITFTRLLRNQLELTTLPANPFQGDPVTLRAHLTLLETGGPFAAPTTPVAFYDGTQLLGTAFVQNGDAYLLNVNLEEGMHTLQAGLIGDGLYADALSNTVKPYTVFLPLSIR